MKHFLPFEALAFAALVLGVTIRSLRPKAWQNSELASVWTVLFFFWKLVKLAGFRDYLKTSERRSLSFSSTAPMAKMENQVAKMSLSFRRRMPSTQDFTDLQSFLVSSHWNIFTASIFHLLKLPTFPCLCVQLPLTCGPTCKISLPVPSSVPCFDLEVSASLPVWFASPSWFLSPHCLLSTMCPLKPWPCLWTLSALGLLWGRTAASSSNYFAPLCNPQRLYCMPSGQFPSYSFWLTEFGLRKRTLAWKTVWGLCWYKWV